MELILPTTLIIEIEWMYHVRLMHMGSYISTFCSEGLRTRMTSVFPEILDLNAPARSIVASNSYRTEPISHSIDSGRMDSRGNSKLYL